MALWSIPILGLYFLPTILGRRKKRVIGIAFTNILFGWTILGWIGTLYWAITAPFREKNLIYQCTQCGFKKGIPKKNKMFSCPLCKTEQKVKRK